MGTIEDVDKALQKVNAQAARISQRPQRNTVDKINKKRKKGSDEGSEAKKMKEDGRIKGQELISSEDQLVNGRTKTAAEQKKEVFIRNFFLVYFVFFVVLG